MTDFKIGADPEFGFINSNDDVVEASSLIADTGSMFGTDGNSDIGEIRPAADEDPIMVVENILDAMRQGMKRNPSTAQPNIRWKAGSRVGTNPIGGHIHFGVKGMGLKADRAIGSLDTWLAQPALLLEDREEAHYRRSHGYGHLADYRNQAWGFEYRTLSSWLTSPQVSMGVLCLAKTIMWEVINHDLSPHTHPADLAPYAGMGEFDAGNMSRFRAKFPTLWEHVKKMELYEKYKEPIDFIGSLIERQMTWFPKIEVREAWGLDIAPPPPPVARLSLPRRSISRIWTGVTEAACIGEEV